MQRSRRLKRKPIVRCSVHGGLTNEFLIAYFHNLRKTLVFCVECIKKYAPIDWNKLKDELEKIYLEVRGSEYHTR